ETTAATGASVAPHVNGETTNTTLVAPAAAVTAAADRALLLTASAATPSPEPQLETVVIETSEDGLANPHPRYRSLVSHGVGSRSGPDIQYASYFGLKNADDIRAVQIDTQGNIYLAGAIDSGDPDQGLEAFAAKLDSSGQLVYLNIFGGLGRDEANGVDVDAQ